MITKAECVQVGMPQAIADSAEAAGVSWITLLMLAAKYGPIVWAIITADLAAGKAWPDIIKDLLAIVIPQAAPTA